MKQTNSEELKKAKEHLDKIFTLKKLLKQAEMNIHVNENEEFISINCNWRENLELTQIEPKFHINESCQYLTLFFQGEIKEEKQNKKEQTEQENRSSTISLQKYEQKTHFVSYQNIKVSKEGSQEKLIYDDYMVILKPNSQFCELQIAKIWLRNKSVFQIMSTRESFQQQFTEISQSIFNFCEEVNCGEKSKYKFKYQSQFKVVQNGSQNCNLYLNIGNARKVLCQTQIKIIERIQQDQVALFIKGFSIYKYKQGYDQQQKQDSDHYSIQLYNQKVNIPKQIHKIAFEKDHLSIQFNQ